jgi:hypothetical protein
MNLSGCHSTLIFVLKGERREGREGEEGKEGKGRKRGKAYQMPNYYHDQVDQILCYLAKTIPCTHLLPHPPPNTKLLFSFFFFFFFFFLVSNYSFSPFHSYLWFTIYQNTPRFAVSMLVEERRVRALIPYHN